MLMTHLQENQQYKDSQIPFKINAPNNQAWKNSILFIISVNTVCVYSYFTFYFSLFKKKEKRIFYQIVGFRMEFMIA
jgi:hypothetical protein